MESGTPTLIPINSVDDLRKACSNPYRMGEYLTDGTQYFPVESDFNMMQCLIESYEGEPDALLYGINWEDNDMYAEDGTKIPPVY